MDDTGLPQHIGWVDRAVEDSANENDESFNAPRASPLPWDVAQEHIRSRTWTHTSDYDILRETQSLNWSTLRSRVRAGIAAQGGGCEVLSGHTATPETVE